MKHRRTRNSARFATLGLGLTLSLPAVAQDGPRKAPSESPQPASDGDGKQDDEATRNPADPAATDDPATKPASGDADEPAGELIDTPAGATDEESEAAPKTAPHGPSPLSLTISGGASLGAHEAGYLYYLTEALRYNRDKYRLVQASGASAGSINAILSIIESCRPSPKSPSDSLFYESWTDLGLDDLFVPDEATPLGAFSRRAFERVVSRMQKAFDDGLDESCDAMLAITVTRVQPVQVSVKPGVLSLPRADEKFVVRIQGQGPGKPTKASNYVDGRFAIPQPMLPFDEDGSDFTPISELSIASAAFPIAFAPVRLAHCTTEPRKGRVQPCTKHNARQDAFIDGGVFDNTPLGLAVRTAMAGLEPGAEGTLGWADTPDLRRRQLDPSVEFAYVDPAMTAYPALPPEEADELPGSVIRFALDLTGRFINEARTRELRAVAETYPEIGEHITVTPSYHPLISEPLNGFFGFVEKAFRVFDFYQGMYDAARFLRGLRRQRGEHVLDDLVLPELPRPVGSWAPFVCLTGVYDGRKDLAAACSDPALRDFGILMQVTLNRLYSHCHALAKLKPPPTTRHAACRAAMRGASPPTVPGVHAYDSSAWERGTDEGEFDYVLRLLAKYRFRFADLGLTRERADLGLRTIRLKLGAIASNLARAQEDDRLIVDVGAKSGLNALSYSPPRSIFYGTIGHAVELGYSGARPAGRLNWLRGTAGVGFNGWQRIVTSSGGNFAMMFMGGPEFEIMPLGSAAIQARVGLRGGLILSAEDGMFSSPCEAASVSRPCSGLITDVYATLSVFEVARLQFLVQVLPEVGRQHETFVELRPAFGVQFADPF